MAVVSESLFYQAKIAPSYVSSSGYYGYVPPCPITDYENVVVQQHKLGFVGEANDQTNGLSWSFSVPSAMQQQRQQVYRQQDNNQQELLCFNGSAMETDNDDNSRNEYVRVSRCENNRCVIPEAAGLSLDASGDGYDNVYRVAQQHGDLAARTRGNRKRNSAGDPAYIFVGHPNNLTKKPRQGDRDFRKDCGPCAPLTDSLPARISVLLYVNDDNVARDHRPDDRDGGNCYVCDGPRRSGKCGSAKMHYEPRSLSFSGDVDFCRLNDGGLDALNSAKSCREAAGNYDSIGDSDLERPCNLTPNGHDKFLESYLDYEKMLMETHGCSAYHYHRHLHLDIDVLEAEL